ncbi:hypothetical protein KPL71_024562 [Citrus sinensis]|uniref:Uncharacterized protein n=1 Tax=Citrus sinensis TaxID=2711 RepID=A0ACB8ITC5_CITSI|nr:hypothetical protein KPL71_024562 [Citrus sinensis]
MNSAHSVIRNQIVGRFYRGFRVELRSESEMAAATISGRSSSTFARTILRSVPTRASAATPRRPSQVSVSNGFVPSNFSLRWPTRFSPAPSPIRLVRRELSTLVPVHSAISAACLVSRLPTDANISIQENGKYFLYLLYYLSEIY